MAFLLVRIIESSNHRWVRIKDLPSMELESVEVEVLRHSAKTGKFLNDSR